jgi:hypothetical protein
MTATVRCVFINAFLRKMPQDFASGNEELGGDLYLVLELGWLEAVKTHADVAGVLIHRLS